MHAFVTNLPSAGHARNSQLGPILSEIEPSGHIFVSCVQTLGSGHVENSQLGPVLSTDDPSEHNLASLVHALGEDEQPTNNNIKDTDKIKNSVLIFIFFLFFHILYKLKKINSTSG